MHRKYKITGTYYTYAVYSWHACGVCGLFSWCMAGLLARPRSEAPCIYDIFQGFPRDFTRWENPRDSTGHGIIPWSRRILKILSPPQLTPCNPCPVPCKPMNFEISKSRPNQSRGSWSRGINAVISWSRSINAVISWSRGIYPVISYTTGFFIFRGCWVYSSAVRRAQLDEVICFRTFFTWVTIFLKCATYVLVFFLWDFCQKQVYMVTLVPKTGTF